MTTALIIIPAVLSVITIHLAVINSRYYKIFKPVPIFVLLALLAWFMNTRNNYFAWPVFLGLFLGSIGDVFMENPKTFTLSLLSFLIGHIFYIVFFLGNSDQFIPVLLIVFIITSIYAVILFKKINSKWSSLKIPILLYMLIISVMVIFSIHADTATFNHPYLFTAGALFFFTSDGILAWTKMVKKLKYEPQLVLGTYYTAQILFTIGAIIII